MTPLDTGKAIAALRKEAGYTQAALAEALEVSDKAVSKWERGIACPDITLLPKLSVLLDVDIEGLLKGESVQRGDRWRGVLVLDELASYPIYSKPLVYLMLQHYLLVGIRDILIIGGNAKNILGNGEQYGVKFSYAREPFADALLRNNQFISSNTMIIYSNILLYGANLTRKYQNMMYHAGKAVVMKTNNGVRLPLLFAPESEWNKVRQRVPYWKDAEDMIEDFNATEKAFTRGIVAIPMNNKDQLMKASTFVQIIEDSENREIADLNEIARSRGLVHIPRG